MTLLLGFGSPALAPWVTSLLVSCCFATGSGAAVSRLWRAVQRSGSGSVRGYLRSRAREMIKAIGSLLHNFGRIVVPRGAHELRLDFGAVDRFLSVGTFLRGYSLLVGTVFVGAVLSVFWTVIGSSSSLKNAFGAVIGFNTLAVVSCASAATLIVVVAIGALIRIGVIRLTLDLAGTFRRVAGWIGYGTAAGVVMASLLPLASTGLANITSGAIGGTEALGPAVLVELPAAGAVAGYMIGLAVALVRLLESARNLLLRRWLAPSLFSVVLAVMSHWNLGPQSLAQSITEPLFDAAAVDCDEKVIEGLDQGSMFAALARCGDGAVYLSDAGFLWIAFIVVGLIAIVMFVADVLATTRTSRPVSDGKGGPTESNEPGVEGMTGIEPA
ncbi:hypothetical protein GCM10027515_17810 [Schumannella luteola]|uniref:hypothetical protein n=1 Tax=Schumannella luteola TaxID=472059 RepID=UPI00116DC3AC|nr:hypothetical protein [Schumannella luteola]TPX03666.1 hypothetical protein FJ656_15955 [Schumannella luteola]